MGLVFSAKGKPYPGFEIEISTGKRCSVCEAYFDRFPVVVLDNSASEYQYIVLCVGCIRKLLENMERFDK